MIVISDTSPLSVLAEIGELELLRRLYGQVVVPESVRLECIHPAAPQLLAAMIKTTIIPLDCWKQNPGRA